MSRFGALAVQWKSLAQVSKLPMAMRVVGDNTIVTDTGKQIIDFTSCQLAVNLGHGNKYISSGLHDTNGLAYVPAGAFQTRPAMRLAERIIGHLPEGYGKVLFTLGGADANECAAFIAHEYHRLKGTPRYDILSYQCSYHGGSTVISSRLSGDPRCDIKREHYQIASPDRFGPIITNPSPKDGGKASRHHIHQELVGREAAAFIFEGSPGTSGADDYPDNHLHYTDAQCKESGTLSICDEVMSGWGRTGTLFAHMKEGIKPDIITTAKGITSGYVPLGAVILSDHVADVFANHPIMNGQTYAAHAGACAIGNRCMDMYERDNFGLFGEVAERAELVQTLCSAIADKYPFITSFRTNGLLGRFQLRIEDEAERAQLDAHIMEHGVYALRLRDTLMIGPALNMKLETIEDACHRIDLGMQSYLTIG